MARIDRIGAGGDRREHARGGDAAGVVCMEMHRQPGLVLAAP